MEIPKPKPNYSKRTWRGKQGASIEDKYIAENWCTGWMERERSERATYSILALKWSRGSRNPPRHKLLHTVNEIQGIAKQRPNSMGFGRASGIFCNPVLAIAWRITDVRIRVSRLRLDSTSVLREGRVWRWCCINPFLHQQSWSHQHRSAWHSGKKYKMVIQAN